MSSILSDPSTKSTSHAVRRIARPRPTCATRLSLLGGITMDHDKPTHVVTLTLSSQANEELRKMAGTRFGGFVSSLIMAEVVRRETRRLMLTEFEQTQHGKSVLAK